MDEYLSKPLKQNHLMQTILKCATLGGALLDKGRDSVSVGKTLTNGNAIGSIGVHNGDGGTGGSGIGGMNGSAGDSLRPPLELRATTSTGPIVHGSLESPAVETSDMDDPLARVSSRLFPRNLDRRVMLTLDIDPHACA